MSKFFGILFGVPAAVAVVLGFLIWGAFSGLNTLDQEVKESYAEIQVQLDRQANLIPNFANTVAAEARWESDTLTKITEARSRVSALSKLDPSKLSDDPEQQRKLIEAMASTQQAIGGFMNMVQERYPRLAASGAFRSLRTELAGSQNRISVARRNNQIKVREYNTMVGSPRVVIIKNVGFLHQYTTKPYFEAPEASQSTPQVDLKI